MHGLLESLARDGFDVPNLQLNGLIQRFDRTGKKSGWFVGFEIKDAQIGVYGDWKTSERYEYRTEREYTKKEEKDIKKRLKLAQDQAEAERERLQESAKEKAKLLWEQGADNKNSSYLERKLVDQLYGTKTVLKESGRAVLVPMRDSSGELWGVQTIHEDGKKFFLTGQRINGTYHSIGNETDLVYIAEGFATATTIHQATQKQVLVAFNAQNLLHVAKAFKELRPSASLIICGDDDQFTERNGVLHNPGREYADKAAKIAMGKAIYPKFVSLDSKPTDFNDLHVLEGLKVVKEQILGAEMPSKKYVLCLGFNGDKYFYTSSENYYIKTITPNSHNKINLLSLIGLDYWQSLYPSNSDDEVDWTLAFNDLMSKCRKKGPFNVNNIRSTGAWLGEDKELIVNRGDCLITNGKKVGFHSIKSKFIYEPGDFYFPEPGPDLIEQKDLHDFLSTIGMLRWAHKDYFKYLAGWIAIAPFCGALSWRPHIWITGPSGSGKSTIMNEVLHRFLRKRGIFIHGQSTEAGIRQTLGKKALPVVFDEFETFDERSSMRVSQNLELCRQASFESDSHIIKGSASGDSVQYTTRFMVAVSSINVNLVNEADINRFTVCELLRGSEDQAKAMQGFREFQRRVSVINDSFVNRFYNFVFANWSAFSQNNAMIFDEVAKLYSSRIAQQYSPLIAGFQLLQNPMVMTKEYCQGLVEDFDLDFKKKEVEESEEMECLKYILSKKIRLNGSINEDSTYSEMIQRALTPDYSARIWVDALRKNGIVIKENFVYFANNHPEINAMFKGTRWHGIYQRTLVRIKGADNNKNTPVWFGQSYKVTRVPKEYLLEENSLSI